MNTGEKRHGEGFEAFHVVCMRELQSPSVMVLESDLAEDHTHPMSFNF